MVAKSFTTDGLAPFRYEKAYAALIVGFENTTVYIHADNPERLALLNEAVTHGGEPVGWFCLRDGRLEMGLLQEYANELWARQYLHGLTEVIKARIAPADGLA
jgi:hypothetical protein